MILTLLGLLWLAGNLLALALCRVARRADDRIAAELEGLPR